MLSSCENDLSGLRLALTAEVEVDDVSALRDGNGDGVGLRAHAHGRAMPHPRFFGFILHRGRQVHVGANDATRVSVEQNRTVHLRELEEAVRGESDVDFEATVAQRENGGKVTDADEGAIIGGENHIERDAQVSTRGDHLHDVVHALNDTHEAPSPYC